MHLYALVDRINRNIGVSLLQISDTHMLDVDTIGGGMLQILNLSFASRNKEIG